MPILVVSADAMHLDVSTVHTGHVLLAAAGEHFHLESSSSASLQHVD
jgi:hypothetical protein